MRPFCYILLFLIVSVAHAQNSSSRSIGGLDATGDQFVFFNLTSGEIVAGDAAAFGGWDIAFQGTNIQVNGAAQYLNVAYDSLYQAPDSGYLTAESGPVSLPTSSEERWFNYDFNTHFISPVVNRIVLIKTKSGHFAKLQILNYYTSNFGVEGPVEAPRYYSFRYMLQADGSGTFNK
ncbi:MAG: HmuY family protein [Bacteroidetes bacterium]|nr:HmuY family protein [Bacteroidota bacterium]